MIIIINGPLGVGKTEVSWELLHLFERAVMLDGDYLGAVQPFEIYDAERVEYLYQTIRHLVAFHTERGDYQDFVINYVFEEPESLSRLRQLLQDVDDEVYAFRLICTQEEMARRVQARGHARQDEPEYLAWQLGRFQELSAIQESAARRGDLGYVIDTTSLSARQVAETIWANVRERVELTPYDPGWRAAYEAERDQIAETLGDLAVAIEHVGSTAVPGLTAKPVIDIMVAVRALPDAAECIGPLSDLGYTFIDFAQNTERRFFRKGFPRTHHLHIVAQDSTEWRDHIDFREALRADPETRQAYVDLKTELAEQHRDDRATYSARKGAFIQDVLARWRSPGKT